MEDIFKGKWITAKEFTEKDNNIKNFYMYVEKSFPCPCTNGKFTIRISADDYYKLYINKKFVCQGVAGGYLFNYNYNEVDITDFLLKGEVNKIEITVYYQGLINRAYVSGDNCQGVIADIYCEDKLLVSTDKTWLYRKDLSFTKNEIIGYETAFLEHRDLRSPKSELEEPAEISSPHIFAKKPFPTVVVYDISPNFTFKTKHGTAYDFGKERVGTIKLKLFSHIDAAEIIVHHSEELTDDNELLYDMRCGCKYEESYILKKGENIIEQFEYKGFRYFEVITHDSVELKQVKKAVQHFPFKDNMLLSRCESSLFQKIFALCKDTVKYGSLECFVDCPTREKGQYFGDVTIAGFAHLYLTGDERLLKKALINAGESIAYSGEFLAVSPCSLKQKIADYALQLPFNAWRYYEYTKDRAFLKEMLKVCLEIIDYFKKFADETGLLNKVDTQWNLVDWPDNFRDGYDFDLCDPISDGKHNVINAFYLGCIRYTQKIKKELNIPFEDEFSLLKKAFNRIFFDKETMLYKDSEKSSHSSLHGNCLPVFFGIYEEDSTKAILNFLKEKGLCCGVYMSYFYLSSLCDLGDSEASFSLVVSKTEHSWYNMLQEGATTCFEAWGKKQKWNTSLFHPWATAPLVLLYERYKEAFACNKESANTVLTINGNEFYLQAPNN